MFKYIAGGFLIFIGSFFIFYLAKTRENIIWSNKEIVFNIQEGNNIKTITVVTGLRGDGIFVWKRSNKGFGYNE